ncbi:phosphogluconate dehydrogenase (NADP(+)-dependent, decarboxylating) [Deinococcus irradiatisoli]|uniref:6-phosphogluconate dehydrogenase, decarboxylating n=1 Tax=Deinococcus irradiatisoli TaxID=2202254 RepID=A0A2Z3JHU8_9DEIO|nr:decarboxylating NADP(+)-dependent phosphogluconate dehydrogenase [Deinococcus irradiatisoli]AWN23576.1 phosphogluconate dehydrogenase (NADP(+)-dependent, decarboxylating) [Deinococcus irradiatisoli]
MTDPKGTAAATSAELSRAAQTQADSVHSSAVGGSQLIVAPVTEAQADIGVIGLAVMGENLILNMASKGFTVAAFNRTTSKVDDFVTGRAKGHTILGADDLPTFVSLLKKPRKVMLMVKAGPAVDAFIEMLAPLLDEGDIIIDGGNTHFPDTVRREKALSEQGLLFVGAGVSGGEEGALTGPSIMPGGNPAAWPALKPIFQTIAAQVHGQPCCDWVGDGGAGHFVKMVHNGIEYADMQMISEAYSLLSGVLHLSASEIGMIFEEWNKGELDSYLIEITAEILHKTDDETGKPMVDVILDTAGQKGTGKWTSVTALDVGAPANTIAEAVFARILSSLKDQRVAASEVLRGPDLSDEGDFDTLDRATFTEQVRRALYASKICSYAQGFQMMELAAAEYGWTLNFGAIAQMWRGGCIIRAAFLDKIKAAFDQNAALPNLLLDAYFTQAVDGAQGAWRQVVATSALRGVWTPAFSSALAYYDGYRQARLSANILQAQRDYFGAHTYERVDKPRGEFFHTNWTGRGGTTASSTYNV